MQRTGAIVAQSDPVDGYSFYTVEFNTPVELQAGSKYWMEIVSDATGWELTTASVLDAFASGYNIQTGGNWLSIEGGELVYSLICETLGINDFNKSGFNTIQIR